MALPVDAQRSAGDPRGGAPRHAHPADRDVEPRLVLLLEADAVQPDPPLGVLGAPVVADHPAPAVELDRAAGKHERAFEARRGRGARELRARQRGAVEAARAGGGAARARREAKRSDQRASPQAPSARPGPSRESPTAIHPPAGTESSSVVSLCMNGARVGAVEDRAPHRAPRRPSRGACARCSGSTPRAGRSGATARR